MYEEFSIIAVNIHTCLVLFIFGGNAGGSGGNGLVPLEVVILTLSSEPLKS